MAHVNAVKELFSKLYPDITIVYANQDTVDEQAMAQVPQWMGVHNLLDTIDHRILEAVRFLTPRTQTITENSVLDGLKQIVITTI